jgi:uncharacterized protein
MIIDVHTHIFPKQVREERQDYFTGESAFKLLYDSPKARLVGAKDLVASMDEQGVDRSVIFGFPWKNLQTSKLQNDYIMASVTQYPDRLIGLCCLDPASIGADNEVERCLSGGLSGLGELAFYEAGIDDAALDALDPLMNICQTHDVPVMIHTNEPIGHLYPGKSPNTLVQIYQLARRFPANKIILAHWGGGLFLYSLLKKEVKESLENLWFDTAASPFLYDPEIWQYAAALAGAEKILFGTDYPLLKPQRYFKEIENSGLSETDVDRICGGNAAKLFRVHP